MNFLQIKQPDIDVPADSVVINKLQQRYEQLSNMTWEDRWNTILTDTLHTGFKLLGAVAVFIIGRWLIKKFDTILWRIFDRKAMDTSLNSFIRSIVKIFEWIFLLMIIVTVMGIRNTSFLAILASASFAIGLALSGTLQNFAGGILILLLKPFRTGDYIVTQSQEGTVKEINIFNTILISPDNRTIIVPNGGVSTNVINNISKTGMRRIEWTFSISYGDNYDEAKDIIRELIKQDARILSTPPYFIALSSLSDSAVQIVVRAWTNTGDFWDVFYDMNEKVYKIFPEHGLTIPSRQMDITVNTIAPKGNPKPERRSTVKEIHDRAAGIGNDTKFEDNSITCTDLGLTPGGGHCKPKYEDRDKEEQ